jgi:hypothetical protein
LITDNFQLTTHNKFEDGIAKGFSLKKLLISNLANDFFGQKIRQKSYLAVVVFYRG